MPALEIRLLGRPAIERDGVPVAPPRGHKAWAVLAYLALAERPVPRARLAELLFGEAGDPLGALRWTLAQLRRALALPGVLEGDPLRLRLPDGARLDVAALEAGGADPELARGALLEGAEPEAGAVFEAWLLVERRRLAGLSEAVLRDAAQAALAAGEPERAVALARRAIVHDPHDDAGHELLVRCLARAGDPQAARDHADAAEALFRRELGRPPDPGVRQAAGESPRAAHAGDRAAAEGQLEAGRAALAAGAVEPGIACLRQACEEARGVGEPALLARALATLGSALVHAVRGRDAEGATLLHESLRLAQASGQREVACRAARQLGYVAVQAGHGVSAGRWLALAASLAADDAERAAILGVRGQALSDRAHYGAAVALLTESVALARAAGERRQAAWSLAILARALMLRGQLPDAIAAADESLALVEQERWVAFQPFPEAVRAELALQRGDRDRALALLDHAFALGCRMGDPCWEGVAARARGLAYAAGGDADEALVWLRDAVSRVARVADPYEWMHAYCLDALARVAGEAGAPDARERVAELEALAGRGDMRELIVRAALHRARLGDPGGLEPARLLAEGIESPALHAELLAAA